EWRKANCARIATRSIGPRFLASNGTMHQATRLSRAKSLAAASGGAAFSRVTGPSSAIAHSHMNPSSRKPHHRLALRSMDPLLSFDLNQKQLNARSFRRKSDRQEVETQRSWRGRQPQPKRTPRRSLTQRRKDAKNPDRRSLDSLRLCAFA